MSKSLSELKNEGFPNFNDELEKAGIRPPSQSEPSMELSEQGTNSKPDATQPQDKPSGANNQDEDDLNKTFEEEVAEEEGKVEENAGAA